MARPVTVGSARRVAGLDFKTMIAPFRIPLISAGEYKLMALGPGLPPRAVTRQTPFLSDYCDRQRCDGTRRSHSDSV